MSVGYYWRRALMFSAVVAVAFILISNFQYASGGILPSSQSQGSGIEGESTLAVGNHAYDTPKPMASFTVSLTPSSSAVDLGQSVTFTAVVSPSSSSYTYQWYVNGVKVGFNSSSYDFLPSVAGSYSVFVNVTLSSTTVSSNTATVTVYPAPTVTISPSSAKIHVGQTIVLNSNVTGGTGKFSYLWYLNGSATSITSSTYSFTPAGNATYYFYVMVTDIGTVNGAPTITVKSNNAQITAVFSLYPVIFEESGLPAGTEWYVNLSNGQSHPEIGTLNLFYEPNGTYTFTVASGNKIYSPTPSSGTFIVDGNTVSLTIYFSPVLYHVFFNQSSNSQLPAGERWYVNISGQASLSSTSVSIVASIPNGTYNFTISTGDKEYYPTPYSASLRINGHPVVMLVTFSLFTYPVEFTETGLPVGTQWYVEVSGNNITNTSSSASQTITFNLPNGSYSYFVKSGVQTYGPFPSNGRFNVSGSPVSMTARFLRLYQVTFYEYGLPVTSGKVEWFVNISGALSYNSTGAMLSFWEPNGTWYYSVATNDRWYIVLKAQQKGSFTVDGASISPFPSNSPIVFYELFNVTFTEQKLPAGTHWFVNISNGSSFSSVSPSLKFIGINGTYNYSVSTGNKLYRPSPYQGSFVIRGNSISLVETFYLVTYPVTFSETGLVNGTIWSITVNNNTLVSTNSTIIFRLSNGTFQYSIQSLPGFSTEQYVGNFTVNGTSMLFNVPWMLVTYYFNVTQSGLSSKTKWSVVIEGRTFYGSVVKENITSLGSLISFQLPNGSYNFTVNPPLGYSGSNLSGKVTIRGNSSAVAVKIVPPNYFLIGLGSGITVAAVAAAIILMIRRENRSILLRRDPLSGRQKEFKFRK
ncbi:MAG: hypothetical protein ACP5UO_04860 [Thermoplasmata archaeon]